MPVTTNRGYSTPVHGGGVDTWDGDLNTVFNQIDQNFGAVASVSVTSTNVTLNSSQYVCGTISLSGTLTANCIVLFPNVQGWWTVINGCTVGAFYVACRLAAGGNRIGIPPGEAIDVYSDGTNMGYRNLGRIGSYLDLASTAVPAWVTGSSVPPALLCDGSTYSAVTYPKLNAILGTTTLPDFRGRMAAFLNGGTGRITTAGSGIDGDTRFSGGGAQNQLVLQANFPTGALNGVGTPLSATASVTAGGNPSYNAFGANTGFTNNSGPLEVPAWSDRSGLAGLLLVTLPNYSVSVALGGSATPLTTMPPACIAGIRMIYAA